MVKSHSLTLAQLQKLAQENDISYAKLKKATLKAKLKKAGVDMSAMPVRKSRKASKSRKVRKSRKVSKSRKVRKSRK